MFGRAKPDTVGSGHPPQFAVEDEDAQRNHSIVATEKSFWERLWPVLACGSGLFSDGYLNNVIGSVSTILGIIYPTQYANSPAQSNVSSITFAGTVLGMLIFGYTSDHWSRSNTLLLSTVILIVFAALGAASYGAHDSAYGLFAALTAYRFFLGMGIGGEYPAGSVACAESTGELKAGTRNRWFIAFTNVMIDWGFVAGALVPMIVVLATTEKHLRAAWRIMLGLGVIPPLSLLYLRIKLKEPEAFAKNSMRHTKTPYKLVFKFYGWRLLTVALVWFIYDFNSYSFGIYSSSILDNLLGTDYPLWVSFGWNTLINFFYVPGAMFGMFLSDWVGPRKALVIGVTAEAVVGFIMAGCYKYLDMAKNIGGFVVVYGIFLAMGEVGPGDNIGLIASKTCASGVRGQYYGIAAAMGKIGAFCGTQAYGRLYHHNLAKGDKLAAAQEPFFIASAMCVVSALITWFLIPEIHQDTIDLEDARFRAYLEENGYDTSKMGSIEGVSVESLPESQREVQEVMPEKHA